MIIGSMLIGMYGIATMLLSIHYTKTICSNIAASETTLTAFFLRDEIIDAIKLLPAAMVVFSVTMGLATIGYYSSGPLTLLTEAPTIGSIVLFTTFLHFCRTLANVTADYT
ncbi:MAG: hypothetical protein SV186_00030 [Candidatus Nanohaloarchaea archaeon]|nr:hypothetical protein [Candidatus Nanohaloarchaea archaeon]